MKNNIRRKLLSVILTLAMAASLLPAVTPAASAEYTATDTMTNLYNAVITNSGTAPTSGYYSISNETELGYLANYVGAGKTASGVTFYLTAGIVLNDESFTFDPASGIVKVTDGTNTGYLGTGIKGTEYHTSTASTAGTWYTDAARTSNDLSTGTYGGTLNSWKPIGTSYAKSFAGTFDGGGHPVSGIYYFNSGSYSSNQGLFGYIGSSGTVKNLGVKESIIIGGSSVGGIVGFNCGSVTGCSNMGIVVGRTGCIGGIAGYNDGATVTDCSNSGVVIGSGDNIGGVAGFNCGTLSYSYNVGAVIGSGNYIGGVVGGSYGTSSGMVKFCYNVGTVKSTDSYQYVGGVLGAFSSSGGLLTNCYNAGSVSSGGNNIGGVVGRNMSSCTVSYCYNVGRITFGGSVTTYGSIAGANQGTVTSCYYDKQMCPPGGISDQDDVGKAEGKLTTDMIYDTIFNAAGWSIGSTNAYTWKITPGTYPCLTGMDTTDAAYVSTSPVKLTATDSANFENVSSVKTNFTVSTDNSVSWASSDATVISVVGSSATVNKSGKVTLTASKGDVSRFVELTSTYVEPVPTALPTGGSFTDRDRDSGEISGTISWTAASTTSTITGYHIYWGSDATTKLTGNTAVVYTVTGVSSTSQTVAADTTLPTGAKYFLIYSYNGTGDSASCLAVSITDSNNVDYIVTNSGTLYEVDGSGDYDTLTAALSYCSTCYTGGSDPYSDGKLIIQLGTSSASPLVIPQVLKSDIPNYCPNSLVSATYTGNVSITYNSNYTNSITYGLYVPSGITAHLSGLNIAENSTITPNTTFYAVYDSGTLYVEDGTAIETTLHQACVGVAGESAKFYMTGGALSHDDTYSGWGCCVYFFDGSTATGEISGGTISSGKQTHAVNLTSGSSLTVSGTAAISAGSATESCSACAVCGSGNLTINGGTLSSGNSTYVITSGNGGTVTMTGGKVENTVSSTSTVYGIYSNGATVTISGGEIKYTNTGTGAAYGIWQNSAQGGLLISGGTIDLDASTGAAVYNSSTATVSISGGGIESNSYAIQNIAGGAVNISGGTVTATGTSACIDNEKGTVAISEISAGTPTRIISVGTTVNLAKDASTPAATIFGKTFHSNANAGAVIKGAANDGKYEINSSNYGSATATASYMTLPVAFSAWTSDAALKNSVGTINGVTITSLTTGDNDSVTDIYIKAIAPIPTVLPTNGSFTDGDSDASQISGTISWTAASPTTGITGYHIYWGSDATTKLAGSTEAVYTVSGASSTSQAVEADKTLPSGAKYFLIYSYNSGGDSSSCLAVRIIDMPYAYSGGSGTETDPYQISTAGDLEMFASLVNSGTNYTDTYFKQTANINLNEGVTFTFDADTGLVEVSKQGETTYWLGTGTKGDGSGENTTFDGTASTAGAVYTDKTGTTGSAPFELNYYTPIGTSSHAFTGTFDGDGKTVSGIYINGASYNQGLFGYTGSGSTVKNAGVVNSYIKGGDNVGGVVGYNNGGTVQKSYNTGTVTGGGAVGGVVGMNMAGTVKNSYNTGTVTGSGQNIGGVSGYNAGPVEYSYNTGSVTGGGVVGGVAGYNTNTVQYSCNTGNVFGSSLFVGGVAGDGSGTVQYCYNAGGVTGSSLFVGGILGRGTAAYCYYNSEKCSVRGIGDGETSSDTADQAEGKQTSAMQGDVLKTGSSGDGWTTDHWTFTSGAYPKPGKTEVATTPGGSYTPSRTITVTETSSALFSGSKGEIKAEANVNNAFSSSVEVKVTDTETDAANFGLGAGSTVYPFDISLYIKGTNTKTEPNAGYAVKISLPIPDELLDVKDQISIMHKSDDGTVTTLSSQLTQINGVWYLVFEATEFSPYALVVNDIGTYDETAGLPYYVVSGGNDVFIGFAAGGKYIAPEGVTVLVKQNAKSFSDTGSHWAKSYVDFVTERELFAGTGNNAFSPDTGMTRAMFATVIGRLYERSYGEIEAAETHSFTDCDYDDYYGKYVDWAAKEDIIGGYGNGEFGPDDQISREQMAAILYRFADFLGVLPADTGTELDYPDAGDISSWAQAAALYCQSTGIITGRDGGSFAPQGTATRAEVAVILERFIKNVLD